MALNGPGITEGVGKQPDLVWINQPLEVLGTSLQVFFARDVQNAPKGDIFPGSYRAQAARVSTRFISKAYKLPLQRSVQVPFAMDKPPSNLGKGSIKLFQKVTSFLAVTARDHADS